MGTKKKYFAAIACVAVLCLVGIFYMLSSNYLCNFENPPRLLRVRFSESDSVIDLEIILIMQLKNGAAICPYSDACAKSLVKHDPEGFFSRPSLFVKDRREIMMPLSNNADKYVLLIQNRKRKNDWDGFYRWEITSAEAEGIKGDSCVLPPVESIEKFGFQKDTEILLKVFDKADKQYASENIESTKNKK